MDDPGTEDDDGEYVVDTYFIYCKMCGFQTPKLKAYEVVEFQFAQHLKQKHGIAFPDLPDFDE